MGKIKKILENELAGGTQTTDVYPVTSTKAVYDENNKRLDEILVGLVAKSDIVSTTGSATDKVMSQHGVTEAINGVTNQVTDLAEKVNGKQDALTLTVKDNGNIVITNIQGQSKEFMPATPSGDPMHYAYVAAGAEYNDTGADIVKDAPWADMLDDDYDGPYGKTVIHKAGYWYLNGLGDITNDEIRDSYNKSIGFLDNIDISEYLQFVNLRTNFSKYVIKGGYSNVTMNLTFSNSNIEVVAFIKNSKNTFKFNIAQCVKFALNSNNLRHILGVLSFSNIVNSTRVNNFLLNCTKLNTIKLVELKLDINLHTCGALSVKSVLYMIKNEKATSPITITLHTDVYNRCMANADILAALEQHTNISLASA